MFKSFLCLALLSVAFTSCTKSVDPLLIQQHSIGSLTDSTIVKDLKLSFPSDSIAAFNPDNEFTGGLNNIDVYRTDGEHLLILSPIVAADSSSTIGTVRIISKDYKTAKGISLNSTFKDIKGAYKISKINNLINTVLISIDDINASFTIDKKELPAELRYDMNIEIEAVQIPDDAKIKYFFLNWN